MTARAIYLKSHPFVFAFALSAILSGFLVAIDPQTRAASLTLVDLPGWIAYCWSAMLIAGGSSTVYGIWTCSPRYEGAGVSALAATQLFVLVTGVAALGWHTALLGTVLRAGLAVGLVARAYVLARES